MSEQKSIYLSGKDCQNFLNSQAANELKDEFFTAFLRPKAEIVALAWVKKSQQGYEIFCHNPQDLKDHLEKFIIIEDVELELREVDCHAPAGLAMTDFTAELAIIDDSSILGKSIIKVEEAHPATLDKFVSFNKGCYPGQEVLSKFKNLGMKKRKERSQKYLDEALAIFAAVKDFKDLDPAIELLKKAIKEDGTNEDAYESLGVMLAKQENYSQAIKVMHQLEMINPQNQMAQMNLSIFYMKIGDKESAEEHKAKGTVLEFDKALAR